MAMKIKVKIENLDKTIEGEVGQDLRTILLENDIDIYLGIWKLINCHGHGTCGSCRIEVTEGEEGMSDCSRYQRIRAGAGRRLACQTRIYRDATIRTLPKLSEIEYEIPEAEA